MAARRRQSGAKLARAYRELWQSPNGRLVLADLLTRSGVLLPAQSADGTDVTDPVGLGIAEGMRRVGLHITDQICAKPDEFVEVSRDAFDTLGHYYEQEIKH